MTVDVSVDALVGTIRPLAIPVTTVDVALISGECVLFGWSLRETTGAAVATCEMQDSGGAIGEIGLAAGGVNTQWFGSLGVHISGQVKLHVVAGSVTGVAYVLYDR